MSDIVERLRDGGVPDHNVFPLRCEAAAEVERLRAALQAVYADATTLDEAQVYAFVALGATPKARKG